MKRRLLLKGGLVYSNEKLALGDVLVEDDVIVAVEDYIEDLTATVIDLRGKIVSPGFLDIHCHIRTPGQEYKEDILSATKAAVTGGYTGIVAMANTSPVIDNLDQVQTLKERIKKEALCDVHVIGAVTKGLQGKEFVDYEELQNEVVAFSDDGVGVQDEQIMEIALARCTAIKKLIISHCEYETAQKGVINKGQYSENLGVHGIDNATEWAMVEREVKLAKKLNAPIHIAHVSTKESVEIIREAKNTGVKVTAEACPHHFLLTDAQVVKLRAMAKVNPPLRSESDRLAVLNGLIDGTIDCIATDHAPHSAKEKELSMEDAPFGMVGLETAVSLCLDLVNKEILTLERFIEALGVIPYRVVGLEGGRIEIGQRANLAILELSQGYRIDKEKFSSKGKNTPFDQYKGKGVVYMTMVDGVIKYQKGGDELCL